MHVFRLVQCLILYVLLSYGEINSLQAQQDNLVPGNLTVKGNISLSELNILGGGVLDFSEKLLFKRGGDGSGLPPSNGNVRAQPGGNLELLPVGDYCRSALDIYPTQGKKPDMDALAELTIHRMHPSDVGHEMMSMSALADSQQRFGLIVEAHGKGRVKPLDLQMIQGGLLEVDKDIEPFNAIAIRIKTDGTAQFNAIRNGGQPGPVDAISIERDNPHGTGYHPSDFLRWTAKHVDETSQHFDWRANVQFSESNTPKLAIESREGDASYQKKMEITSTGDIELPIPDAGIILTSPNGKRWRIGVTDDGELEVIPANELD